MWQSVSVGVLFYVMSLSIGKAPLPFAHRLVRHVEGLRQLQLGQATRPAVLRDELPEGVHVHGPHLGSSVPQPGEKGNQPEVERGFSVASACLSWVFVLIV